LEYVFVKYSQQFYKTPTAKQFANPNNLFALVYKVKAAMRDFGYPKTTISSINCYGFNRIVRHFVKTGAEHYCQQEVLAFVESLRNEDLKTPAGYKKHIIARKCAQILDQYYKTGKFEWFTLKHKVVEMPQAHFMNTLEAYLQDCVQKNLYKEKSVTSRRHVLRRFMLIMEGLGYRTFEDMGLADMKKCMMAYIEQRDKNGQTLSKIRVFLRYLRKSQKTNLDLALAISRKASSPKKVIKGYDDTEIDALFYAVDNETAVGKREFAVMIIALMTGLRASDIAEIKHSDIDWRNDEINLIQGKTNAPIKIWLSPEVGNTIADYILNARPKSDSPYIFLRHLRPYERLSTTSISRSVRKYVGVSNRSGKPMESRGFHGLRRTFGMRLLQAQTPLELITEMLGHVDIDSSKPYLAADEKGLKLCALPLVRQSDVNIKLDTRANEVWMSDCALPLIQQNKTRVDGALPYV
jgi:site-specific recombinase XerD